MRSYNIFISHSWRYWDTYDKLVSMFTNSPFFDFKNYSVPKDDPIHNAPNATLLEIAIENQIKYASIVLIPVWQYATYSKWINIEIKIAKKLSKPIIAIEPWGSYKTSIIKEKADKIVWWNAPTIIQAIKDYSL